jgi:alkaline phosphatase
MDRMPVTGLATTYCENGLVTDSAAAATALATGFKTNGGMVGMLPDGRNILTILEASRDRGMATGLAVVCTINHATPAGFAAHVASRNSYPQIFEQVIRNKVDVLFGAGNAGTATQPSEEAIWVKKNGYRVVSTRNDLRAATDTPVIGLMGIEEPSAGSPEPMLAEMTVKAIELLGKDPDGFFLMVEGSDIDWACHGNDMAGSIRKTLLFDLAVKEALEFALRDKHTLVVVTADHDTGGMGINGGSTDGTDIGVGWTTKGHTGIPVPIYAFGPGARRFMGVHDNTEIPCIFAQLLGIKDFPKAFPKKDAAKKVSD